MQSLDPIVALATPPGRAGLAVVRVSGNGLLGWLPAHMGWKGEAPARALRRIVDAQGALIDQPLVLSFAGPRSFTGEDTVELHCHGSPIVVEMVMARVLELGRQHALRLAEPGEFSQRAFLNGRIDLAQAEAIADLVAAESALQARGAARAMQGEVSSRVRTLLDGVQHLRMLVEAALDFPEEPVESLASWGVDDALGSTAAALRRELPAFRQGAMLQQGLRVALIGPPNVGKSSLLNALAGGDLAIVDPEPGTTRDRIAHTLDLEGYRVVITDTAGIRAQSEAGRIEALGMARSWQAAAHADLILLMTSAEEALGWDTGEISSWPRLLHAQAQAWLQAHLPAPWGEGEDAALPRILVVANKIDLLAPERQSQLYGIAARHDPQKAGPADIVFCSARADTWKSSLPGEDAGIGLHQLLGCLRQTFGLESSATEPLLARARHVDALERALAHLEAASHLWKEASCQADLMAEELRLAQRCLGEIIGAWTDEDLLGEIFRRFCIGK